MTKFDREYLELVKQILNKGVEVENRTGINSIKIPSYNFEFDLGSEFPILESKQFFYRAAVIEMLWIWQMQSNDVRDLKERNVKIWDEWMVDSDGIYRIYEPEGTCPYDPDREVMVMDPLSLPVDDPFGYRHNIKPKYDNVGRIMTAKSLIPGKTIKAAKYFGEEYAYTIGTAYGDITRRYQMMANTQEVLRNHRTDRRQVNSLWQNEFLRTAVLPSCVWSNEWDVTGDKLNLSVHQRSCDVPLGLPFNITQYAVLLRMMAQSTGLEPGIMSYSIKDAHIYVNQVEQMKEQLHRFDLYNKTSHWDEADLIKRQLELNFHLDYGKDLLCEKRLKEIDTELRIIDMILNPSTPELWLNPDIKDFFDFDNSKDIKDVKVLNYKHMGSLKIPIAQ